VIKGLVAASIVWPLLLASGAVALAWRPGSWPAAAVYAVAGTVCHQRDDRSFHTHGVKWPVCARCSGLYLSAPVGALAAAALAGSLRRRRDLGILAIAAAGTAVSFAVEHGGIAPLSSTVRFAAALPLGAALAWVIVRAARGPGSSIG
jgi:uncharacterized membrane protein